MRNVKNNEPEIVCYILCEIRALPGFKVNKNDRLVYKMQTNESIKLKLINNFTIHN